MQILPELTEADVRAITDSGSFNRGRGYYQEGAIINPRRQGMKLQAQAMGTDLYRTEVTLNEHGIDSTKCSCPVGSECKHVVALLLTYVHKPQSFSEVSDTRKTLEARSQPQLIDLILKMIDHYPELETLVELPVVDSKRSESRIDPQTILRQIRGESRRGRRGRYDYDDYYGGSYENAEPAIDTADQFTAAGDWGNAILAYATVIKELTENYEEYSDHEGGLGDTMSRCMEGLETCLDGAKDAANRQQALRTLWELYLWDVDQGGIGESDGATHIILAAATRKERELVVGWVEAALPAASRRTTEWATETLGEFLLSLQLDTLDDEGYIAICRQTGRFAELIDRLLQLKRIDEAVAIATGLGAYDLLMVESIFVRHQQSLLYEQLVHESWQQGKDSALLQWMKKRASEQGNKARVVEYAQILFAEHATLELYREIKRGVESQTWQQIQPKLRSQVTVQNQHELLVRIYLEDQEFDAAIKAVREGKRNQWGWGIFSEPLEVEVAATVEQSQPHEAIAIYNKVAEAQISQRNRQNYAVAASHLQQIKRIYQRIGEDRAWQKLISGIREQYKSLRALQDELKKAGL